MLSAGGAIGADAKVKERFWGKLYGKLLHTPPGVLDKTRQRIFVKKGEKA